MPCFQIFKLFGGYVIKFVRFVMPMASQRFRTLHSVFYASPYSFLYVRLGLLQNCLHFLIYSMSNITVVLLLCSKNANHIICHKLCVAFTKAQFPQSCLHSCRSKVIYQCRSGMVKSLQHTQVHRTYLNSNNITCLKITFFYY